MYKKWFKATLKQFVVTIVRYVAKLMDYRQMTREINNGLKRRSFYEVENVSASLVYLTKSNFTLFLIKLHPSKFRSLEEYFILDNNLLILAAVTVQHTSCQVQLNLMHMYLLSANALAMRNLYKGYNKCCFFFTAPPLNPTIFDDRGKEVPSVAGPYEEGREMKLLCVVSGGKCL